MDLWFFSTDFYLFIFIQSVLFAINQAMCLPRTFPILCFLQLTENRAVYARVRIYKRSWKVYDGSRSHLRLIRTEENSKSKLRSYYSFWCKHRNADLLLLRISCNMFIECLWLYYQMNLIELRKGQTVTGTHEG